LSKQQSAEGQQWLSAFLFAQPLPVALTCGRGPTRLKCMPLRIRCPSGHKLIVPDDRAGRSLRCPRCGQVTQVPAEEVGQVSRLPSNDAFGEQSLATHLAEVPASTHPAAALNSSASNSSVLDWPNSIAAPATAAALEEPIPPPIVDVPEATGIVEPVPSPSSVVLPLRHKPPVPKTVVKPKSRALPTFTQSASNPDIAAEEASSGVQPLPAAELRELRLNPLPVYSDEASVEALQITAEPTEPSIARQESQPIAELLAKGQTTSGEVADVEIAAPPVVSNLPPAPQAVLLGADRGNVWAAYQLAAAIVIAALFSIAPAVWDVIEYAQVPEGQFIARWALALFLLGAVQLAYAAFLVQLPDWTSVWVVTIYSLSLAAVYAAVLGLVLLTSEHGLVVTALQLSDKLAGGKAVLWCLSMVSVSTILAFFAGRLSTRWHRMEGTLRGAGL
jgi:hypothetical protein